MKSDCLEIAVIGAGGTFASALIREIYQTADAGPVHLRLMDLRLQPLEAWQAAISRLNEKTGKSVRCTIGTDRRNALRGADHVVAAFAVDFPGAFLRTCAVLRNHGIGFAEAETATPGALMATMRHLPPLLALARK